MMSSDAIMELLLMIDRKVDDLKKQAKSDIDDVKESVDALNEKVTVQNSRVGKLELWRYGLETVQATHTWRFPAIVGLTSAVIVLIVSKAIEMLFS